MSPIYKCNHCRDSGYITTTPPVEPCPYCEHGQRIAATLDRQPWLDPAPALPPSAYNDSERVGYSRHAPQPAATSTFTVRGEPWSPSAVARLLKIALYAGASVGVWWLLRLSSGAGVESDALEVGAAEPDNSDYSTWEPEK